VTAHVRRIKGPAAADGQVGQIHGVSTMNTSQALMPARCYRFAATAAYSLSFTLGGGSSPTRMRTTTNPPVLGPPGNDSS
jgi:hypothetical protein